MEGWNYLDWVERAGVENLKQRLETSSHLQAQASTLLQLLLAGSVSSVVLVFKQDRLSSLLVDPVSAGYLAAGLWMTWIAIILLFTCVRTRFTELVTNEPMNLFNPDWEKNFSESDIRQSELKNLQTRINITKDRNIKASWWLDACRYAATATPLVFSITFWACQ